MRRFSVLFRLLSLVLIAATGLVLRGQSPAFEVATVKINHTGESSLSLPGLRNGTLTARNVTMRMLLRVAYDVSGLRISGPGWLDSDRYDLAGKSPEGVPDSELRPMLQALLRDRLHLVIHREMKEIPVFDMVVAKGGLKMAPFDPAHPDPPRGPIGGGPVDLRALSTNGVVTMSELAGRLDYTAGRPVLDKTGVEGRYGYFLMYTPETAQSTTAAVGHGAPDFFKALEQQLGLKMEPKKELIEVLVVDHAERVPADN